MIEATRVPFDILFSIIENGSGSFRGALEDIDLSEGSTINYVAPRRILKTPCNLALKAGMIISSPKGMKYMVSNYSNSETSMGSPFNAFRLYETNQTADLVVRTFEIDARTGLKREGPKSEPRKIYVSYEPLQEAFDRQLRIPNEKTRLLTNHKILKGDLVDGETVIEVREALGIYGCVLG